MANLSDVRSVSFAFLVLVGCTNREPDEPAFRASASTEATAPLSCTTPDKRSEQAPLAEPDDQLRAPAGDKESLRKRALAEASLTAETKPVAPEVLTAQAEYLKALAELRTSFSGKPEEFEVARIDLKEKILGSAR